MTNNLIMLLTTAVVFSSIYLIHKKIKNKFENVKTYLLIILVIFLVSCLVVFPNNTIDAALNGIITWANVVLPSLLPFLIGAEILIGLGVVDFIGVLLSPIMHPLFGTSGEGSFAFAMSITSGYPVGVSLVSKLRQENSVSRIEAQRLVSFCSTSGPLFIIGAVSVGMFKNSSIGALLASSHYLGAITVGLIFKNYGRTKNRDNNNLRLNKSNNKSYLKRALSELINTRKKDGRNISKLMGDSIKSSLEAMFMVGGFIMIYSVIIEILKITGVVRLLALIFNIVIPFNIDIKLIEGLISGLLEMTNGCKLISSASNASVISQLCSVSFLIGWSGLSIHSQALSMLSNTDISPKLYILSKALHAFFSSIYCFALYKLMFKNVVVMSFFSENNSIGDSLIGNWIKNLKFSVSLELVILVVIIAFSFLVGAICSLNSITNK